MCTLLAQCASPRIGCWHSRGYAYTASRAWAVKRDHAPSQDSAGASLLDRQTWCSHVTNVGPVRHRAIDSSELRLTTDREGRHVGQGGERTGAGSASRHGGGLGRVHPHDRVPGIPLSYRTGCTRRHGGRRGPPTGCALLVLLLLTRDSDRFAARWTPYSTGDLSRLATFLRLLTSSLSLPRAH